MLRKILRFLVSRTFLFGISILLQLAVVVLATIFLGQYSMVFYFLYLAGSIAVMLFIVADPDENPIYKLSWMIPVALFPVLGWLIYLIFGRGKVSRRKAAVLAKWDEETGRAAPQDPKIMEQLQKDSPSVHRQFFYLQRAAHLPVCRHTQTEFLTPGEQFFKRLCEELKRARRFIFMEYFILEEGKMWNTVRDILAQKAREGVEIKFLFDGFGCLSTLPSGYARQLRQLGIETYVFNEFRPSMDTFMNYRDHRKITVIDGNVGFTGGNNLADEYINACEKHGYWKDSSLLLKGDAVWNLSLLFLQMWQMVTKQSIAGYHRYRPTLHLPSDGYVAVFGDSPLDRGLAGEICYMNLIQQAQESVTVTTPYLILDNEMKTTLCAAAKGGVRIQIITPGVADKWYVHAVTRYNYRPLLQAGVEIYEYTGGFIHAKTIVADQKLAVVGTQNFDFRSFYLHFECNALLYRTSSVADVARDHRQAIARSRQITLKDCRPNPLFRLVQLCLNLFAPLM